MLRGYCTYSLGDFSPSYIKDFIRMNLSAKSQFLRSLQDAKRFFFRKYLRFTEDVAEFSESFFRNYRKHLFQ